MVYRALGLMSGSSLDGLDIALVEFQEVAGIWSFKPVVTDCFPYDDYWTDRLKRANSLGAREYLLLHAEYGHYIGKEVNRFIQQYQLEFQVQLISSHGHTSFHMPAKGMTAQLGDGAAIAAETGINVVSELRAIDIALGGQGAPIVPIGEKLLWGQYDALLNLGGIANISIKQDQSLCAFDVCAANRVLNLLANELGMANDDKGALAASGQLNTDLLDQLNQLDYYAKPFPKSLANEFGTETVYGLLRNSSLSIPDQLHTYSLHIAMQVKKAILKANPSGFSQTGNPKMIITGGGAHNDFLVKLLTRELLDIPLEVEVPEKLIVDFKEAIVMALIGVLRWRENDNVLAKVTGARRDSIGGAVYIGQQA